MIVSRYGEEVTVGLIECIGAIIGIAIDLHFISVMHSCREITDADQMAATKLQARWRGYYVRKIRDARRTGEIDYT